MILVFINKIIVTDRINTNKITRKTRIFLIGTINGWDVFVFKLITNNLTEITLVKTLLGKVHQHPTMKFKSLLVKNFNNIKQQLNYTQKSWCCCCCCCCHLAISMCSVTELWGGGVPTLTRDYSGPRLCRYCYVLI